MQQPHCPHSLDERSPLEYSFGLYIQDAPALGGAKAFSWFSDEAEALDHLCNNLASLYIEGDDAVELEATKQAVTTVLQGTTCLGAIQLEAVNAALVGLCEIHWAGSLDELRAGSKPFERSIQADFHENVFGDERGHTNSEWDDFVHHLTHYSG